MNGIADLLPRLRIAMRNPRWRVAIIAAVLSDAIAFLLIPIPPAQWALDIVTALILFISFGFPWTLLIALAIEVVPGIELFPAWTLAVLAIGAIRYRSEISDSPKIPSDPESPRTDKKIP